MIFTIAAGVFLGLLFWKLFQNELFWASIGVGIVLVCLVLGGIFLWEHHREIVVKLGSLVSTSLLLWVLCASGIIKKGD